MEYFMADGKAGEPRLLGYDAVHLLARRESQVWGEDGCGLGTNAPGIQFIAGLDSDIL
jgi:hypothetical protein